MPKYSPAARLLREDLLAQLRTARRPLSTSELHEHAPRVPTPHADCLVTPSGEQIYRVLCSLQTDGLLTHGGRSGRAVPWTVKPTATVDHAACPEVHHERHH